MVFWCNSWKYCIEKILQNIIQQIAYVKKYFSHICIVILGLLFICTIEKICTEKTVESVNNDLFGLCKIIDYLLKLFYQFSFQFEIGGYQ